jgi:hypothetical protein
MTSAAQDIADTRLPAVALLRAVVTSDIDRAMVIVGENSTPGIPYDQRLNSLIVNLAHLAARALLSRQTYDVKAALDLLDKWTEFESERISAR